MCYQSVLNQNTGLLFITSDDPVAGLKCGSECIAFKSPADTRTKIVTCLWLKLLWNWPFNPREKHIAAIELRSTWNTYIFNNNDINWRRLVKKQVKTLRPSLGYCISVSQEVTLQVLVQHSLWRPVNRPRTLFLGLHLILRFARN